MGFPLPLHLPFLLFFVQEYLSTPFFSPRVPSFFFFFILSLSAVSHRDEDVQVETVVGLPEEEDEDEAEEAGAGQAPVQPRQLWRKETEEEEK